MKRIRRSFAEPLRHHIENAHRPGDILVATSEAWDPVLSNAALTAEFLSVAQQGRHAIRVNDQYRITFRFADGHAHDVRCEDYH